MRFLRSSVLLAFGFIANSLALSDHANDVLDGISAIEESLRSNQKALDRYGGGIVSASPILTGFYDTWTSIRAANVHLPRDKHFTSEDSDAILHSLDTSTTLAIDVMHTLQKKAPQFHQYGTSFLVPVFMEAIDREVVDYRTSLEDALPRKYSASMSQVQTKLNRAWDETFALYDPIGNSDRNSMVMRYMSSLSPFMGLLPL